MLGGKEPACQCRRLRFHPWVRKIPWRRKWQPIPVFLPGKSHGQRSYSPWGAKEWEHNWVYSMYPYSPLFTDLGTSLVAQMVKHLPIMWETRVQSLGWKDFLEKVMATHSSILAWKIPWTEEPGRLQSMGPQRVGHDWATFFHCPRKSVA